MNTSTASCAAAANCLPIYDTKDWDNNSEFSTTTHSFTAAATGYYSVHALCRSSVNVSSDVDNICIYKNPTISGGTTLSGGTRLGCLAGISDTTAGGEQQIQVQDTVSLNSSDVIAVAITNNGGTSHNISSNSGDTGACYMTIEQLPE